MSHPGLLRERNEDSLVVGAGAAGGDSCLALCGAPRGSAASGRQVAGLFGLISTHRDGWRITVADLARHSRDGEGAVKSGLKELEHHGFVVRVRTRQDDGTLGGVVYVITNQPDV
ncbi:hypothetical protein ACFY1U_34995 [Streptomyces sp. NPDC001351]|uniref:hypothetical protein n=1 Tax=Streptomyces sp. NPDC001351 TaxID=3364564 RepID=UPI00369389AA